MSPAFPAGSGPLRQAGATLQSYPAYKDSGVSWLGEVPAHWEIRRGKTLFWCIDVRSSTGQEELLTVSSERGVVPRRSANVTMFKAESYVGYKLCWPGDLVINSLWAWARGLGVSQYHGIVSSAYGIYRLRPRFEDYSQYVHQLVRSTPFQWELQVRSKGVWISRLQLTDEAFLGAPFPLPPTGEQAAIARYLAHIDRRVRRYIRAKQKLIALLNEQKQAIIHQAVTRGLDPNVRLKPSGVEWFQSIPNHWRVAKLATLALKIGDGLHGTPKYVDESDCHFINGNNLADGVIRITPSTRCVDAEELKKYQTDLGDTTLLMSINGTIGNLALYRGESVVLGKSAAYINCADTLSRDYLFFFLQSRSVANYCQDEVTGTTIVNLSLASIRSLPIALPPLDEQLRISKYLSQARESCNRVINSVVCEIERLREYRTRLVADVVTGKLDVREAAAALPEEVEAAEALEEDEAPADEEAAFDEIEAEADTAENSA